MLYNDATMRAVVQRVSRAEVSVGGECLGRIGSGFAVLLGVARDDTEADVELVADRILGLRVFADAAGKMNLALGAIGGELLVISQFTLLADTSGGRRPSFIRAAPPEIAEALYERFISLARDRGVTVRTGRFGAHMELALVNDGPVTIILDSRTR
jgi:D-tyrosyl-tRNA(Tyr) deacylase